MARSRGLHYRQEYLCIFHEQFEQPLRVYLLNNGIIEKEITHEHAFVGYSPVVFALTFKKEEARQNLEIIFIHGKLNPGDKPSEKIILGLLSQ